MKNQKIPIKVTRILKKLNKNEQELGNFCFNNAANSLRAKGYTDAHIWAATILPDVLGEIQYIESDDELEELITELEGMEKDVVEAVCDTLHYMQKNLKGIKQKDIKAALVYSISRTLENLDKEKYKKLYG